jgi:hypothetical protein
VLAWNGATGGLTIDVPSVPRPLFSVCSRFKCLSVNVFPVFPAELACTHMRVYENNPLCERYSSGNTGNSGNEP